MRTPYTPTTPSVPLAQALDGERRLFLRQRRELLEIFTDFEQANKYAITTEGGLVAGWAMEKPGGFGRFLTRSFLKAMRPFELMVFPAEGPIAQPEFSVRRPWTWFFAHLYVWDREGRPIGQIRQRWAWIRRRLDIELPDGRVVARITGPLLHPWTFIAERGPETNSREIGRIEKQWGGLLKEGFTDADTFLVTFGDQDATFRRLLLAAAVLIDFRWFERSN
ncbi:MAG TPA: phospholipid scramblase-related protein [Anaeromyxobacteraceae bacterium]|nr:phospholipid scramblase-related protein [Anaeromyxobacteraceae bacterium]